MTLLEDAALGAVPTMGQVGGDVSALAARMERAARAWLETLTSSQQRVALWPFLTPERGDWHYAPRRRNGLALREMDGRQRSAAYTLLGSTLSPRGDAKARAIMALEEVLGEIEGGRGRRRDPLNYAFTVFGDPGRFPWGWRLEGHHLIVNVTVAGPEAIVITPTFWGTNPARIPGGPRTGERIMAREYQLGLELARSLSSAQRATAMFAERSVGNIIAERGRAQALREPTGLAFAERGEGQRELLMALVGEYVGNAADALGIPYLARVREAGLERLRLAWAGGMAEGAAFYYRIHGPRLLIELDCTQNDANHIHALWRDPIADWGRDVLGEHYLRDHDHD
jgi:hypothetical protein